MGLASGSHENELSVDSQEILDLVSNSEELKIKFPSPKEEKTTKGFRRKSTVSHINCVGHAGHMLV